MRYTVTPDTPVTLAAYGDAAILQCIALILNTRVGDCPGYRGFGLMKNYIGIAERAAISVLRNEVREALQDFEPRALLLSVTAEWTPEGEIVPVVEVEINND